MKKLLFLLNKHGFLFFKDHLPPHDSFYLVACLDHWIAQNDHDESKAMDRDRSINIG